MQLYFVPIVKKTKLSPTVGLEGLDIDAVVSKVCRIYENVVK